MFSKELRVLIARLRSCTGLVLFTAISVFAAAAQDGLSKPNYEEREVRFNNGVIDLAGTLVMPRSSVPLPAVVVIHGSGSSDRTNPWTSAYVKALALRGIAVLHPDKRGSGKSKGDWKKASFSDLADDTIAAVEFLRNTEGIDKARVGVAGFSQGGHIAPLAASRSSAIAFVIDVSGSVVPMFEQISDEIEMTAERAGLTAAQIGSVNEINRKGLEYASTGKGWDEYLKLLNAAKSGDLKGHKLVEGFPSDPNDWRRDFIHAMGNFDPMPYWEKLSQPVLFVFGGKDANIRVTKSVRLIETVLDRAKTNYILMVFKNNGHGIYREDLADFMARWISDKGAA